VTIFQFRVPLIFPTSRRCESYVLLGNFNRKLTVTDYILVKPTLLSQNFQKCSTASLSQACNLCAKRANWHARGTYLPALCRVQVSHDGRQSNATRHASHHFWLPYHFTVPTSFHSESVAAHFPWYFPLVLPHPYRIRILVLSFIMLLTRSWQ
jgi:hypothetical protein